MVLNNGSLQLFLSTITGQLKESEESGGFSLDARVTYLPIQLKVTSRAELMARP